MIVRTRDVTPVLSAIEQYAENIVGLDPEQWLNDENNVALTDEDGNVSMFERNEPGVVTGHYFFFCRGRAAIKLSHEMLREIFTGPYDVEVIRGLTPIDHKGALWMSRHVGFKEYGTIPTEVGPCALFILTKNEYLKESG
jgi:hypothetical protein